MKTKTKKILFAANLDSFFMKFLIPQLKYFKENGYEVHIASRKEDIEIPYCDKRFDIDFPRSLNFKNIKRSYKQMKEVFNNNHYDIVSCHTPFGGAITRYAYKKCKVKNTKMIYMAHGFHFYKGAPFINWLLYYTVEKHLAKVTDDLITINLEDYEIAKKKFKTNVHYVHGVGMNADKFNIKFTDKDKLEYRKSLGINENDFVMIFPAEISRPKRHEWLVKTLYPLLKEHSNFKVLLPGRDSLDGSCQRLVKDLNLDHQIMFLGFRTDIPQLLKISDLSISSSIREGLPVNIMEAMYVGLPVVATNCRGNRDLIENGINGFIVNDSDTFCEKVLYYTDMNAKDKQKIREFDSKHIKPFLLDSVLEEIINIHIK